MPSIVCVPMRISLLILLLLAAPGLSPGRHIFAAGPDHPLLMVAPQEDTALPMFEKIQDALATGSTSLLESRLAAKVYLSLFTGENGYYSTDQTLSILSRFFALHVPMGFQRTQGRASAPAPYLVGSLQYQQRGLRASATVYLSLSASSGSWKVNQITITRR